MSIAPSTFKAPFYTKETCWEKADEFRMEALPDCDFPVDVYTIAEFYLGLEIRISETLKTEFDVDALIDIPRNKLLVDRDQYLQERYQGRVRFSVAHELGHYVLHRDIAKSFPENEDDFVNVYDAIPTDQYSLLEYHANEFAGALLVPSSELAHRLNLMKAAHSVKDLADDLIRLKIIQSLASYFAVSTEVIEKRLHRTKL